MALKKIQYDVNILSTETALQAKVPAVYTNDLNSAEFVFNIEDMTPEQLEGATATTLLYMRDGSFFQNSDVYLNGNTFTYLLKENEGNHAGLAQIQLVVKIGTIEYATQLFNFQVAVGLETKVAKAAVEVMIQDWTALTRDAQAYIAKFLLDEEGRQATFEANEQDRKMAFEADEELRQQNETERQEAESKRIEAEQSRTEAEGARQTEFETDEADRTEVFNANETARQQAETQRTTAESVRVANEAERISKDSERDSKIDSKVNVSELELYAKKAQGTWITPTLINGWYAIRATEPPQYMKDEFGFVHFRGAIAKGASATSNAPFSLPVAYRPTVPTTFNLANIASSSFRSLAVTILANGNVDFAGAAVGTESWYALSSINFKVG